MSLKVRRRPDTGSLEITGTIRPAGSEQGVRIRRRASTDNEALAAEEAIAITTEILRTAWHGERAPTRGFAEAVVSYLKHEPRAPGTKALVARLLMHFRDKPLAAINQEAVDAARDAILRPAASVGTIRRNIITPLRAIMVHASRRGWCSRPELDIPSEPKGRTVFLLPEQAKALIAGASPHLAPLLRFLVCTGCRAGEALALEWEAVDLVAARALLFEGETKSGERRVVELLPAAIAALAELPHRSGRVFLTDRRQPYRGSEDGGGQFRTSWAKACQRAALPGSVDVRGMFRPENTPHHLRHTWATWHYALHRDLLRLKIEGGWSSASQVERYAHLMPAGHEADIRRIWGMAQIDTGTKDGRREA